MTGRKIDFVPDQAREDTTKAVQKILDGKAVFGMETVRKTKDKGLINVRLSADGLKDDQGNFTGIVVTLQDISEIVQSRFEAIQANKAKSDFLSNVSHEIRTPMNGLMGILDLLGNTNLDKEQEEFVSVLKTAAANLMSVISDILDFSNIVSGKLEYKVIDFDLRTTLEVLKKSVSGKFSQKGLMFELSVHHDVPSLIKGDPQQLRQILTHLLDNALKFTEKGRVTVSVHLEKEGKTHALVNFRVKDTGMGIEPGQLKTIFQSFSQGDATATRKHGGTGIGLSISKQLIDMMGGAIEVDSRPGKGSQFSFLLEFEKQQRSLDARVCIPKTIKNKWVLVVDNDSASRLILKESIKSWGCVFEEAANADRAMEKLRATGHMQQKFDFVVIDMQLPGKSGEILAQEIRSDAQFSDIILIVVSAIGKPGDVERLSTAGVQGYLPKPTKPSLLFDCLTTALAMKDQQDKKMITRHYLKENKKMQSQILLVDPNMVNRKILKKVLETSGHITGIAKNTAEAKEVFETGSFQIVIVDASLGPEYEELIETIRALEKTRRFSKTIIIVMTDHKGESDGNLDINDTILKPVTADELLVLTQKWMQVFEEKPEKELTDRKTKDIFLFDEALERAMDDVSFLEEVIQEFTRGLPEKIKGLETAIQNKDTKTLSMQTYSLRGSASNIGAGQISSAVLELEKNSDLGDVDPMQDNLENIKNECQIFIDHINTIKWSDI